MRIPIVIVVLGGLAACVDAPELGEEDQAVYGSIATGADCSASDRTFLLQMMWRGRVASASDVFSECMHTAIVRGVDDFGPYSRCGVDPYNRPSDDASIGVQVDRALRATRRPYPLTLRCSGASPGARASTSVEPYGSSDDESLSYGEDWLDGRVAAGDYGYVAGTTFHEVMHQHGYQHPDSCSVPGYDLQKTSMPNVVKWCMKKVIDGAADRCGAVTCASPSARAMQTRLDGSACECVEDPALDDLGLISLAGPTTFGSLAQQVDGGRIASHTLSSSDAVRGVGDFDGDGRDDFVMFGPDGLALVDYHDGGVFGLRTAGAIGQRLGEWKVGADDRVRGVGDFDGDRADDLVLQSGWGLGVITRPDTGGLRSLALAPYGTRVGTWTLAATDSVLAVADFTNDRHAALLIRSTAGAIALLGVANGGFVHRGGLSLASSDDLVKVADLTGDGFADLVVALVGGWAIYDRATGTLGARVFYPWNQPLPGAGWVLQPGDRIAAVGAFDGKGALVQDARTDAIVVGGGKIGVLNGRAVGVFARPSAAFSDNVRVAADLDGDGADEVLVTGADGLRVLVPDIYGHLNETLRVPFQDTAPDRPGWEDDSRYQLLGSWQFRDSNRFVGVGDFDDNGRDDLLLRD